MASQTDVKKFLKEINKTNLIEGGEWTHLISGVRQLIHDEQIDSRSLVQLSWYAHRVSRSPSYGTKMFLEETKNMVADYLRDVQSKILSLDNDTSMVKSFLNYWSTYQRFCARFSTYLTIDDLDGDVTQQAHETAIQKTLIELWTREMVEAVNPKLMTFLKQYMNAGRQGQNVDSQLVTSLMTSYVSLCSMEDDELRLYNMHYERAYVEAMCSFYVEHACQLQDTQGMEAYITYAHEKLAEEASRIRLYLENRSFEKAFQACIDVLVGKFLDKILLTIANLMRANDTKELVVAFQVMSYQEESLDSMAEVLQQHIQSTGLEIIRDLKEKDGIKFVKQLLILLGKCNCWIHDIFNQTYSFCTARDKAFRFLFDCSTVKKTQGLENNEKKPDTMVEKDISEVLARYFDMLLKRSALTHRLSQSEVEQEIEKAIPLVCFIKDTEDFQHAYRLMLIKRIVLGVSINLELEISIANRIGDTRPMDRFSGQMNKIFKDIERSKILRENFKALHLNRKDSQLAGNFTIIHPANWSCASESIPVSLPQDVQESTSAVMQFYSEQHPSQKLRLEHSFSSAVITFTSDIGKYKLTVTNYQLSVLCAWNSRPRQKLTFENLQLATLLPEDILRSVLWILVACPKLQEQVLSYSPQVATAKDLDKSSEFWPNRSFSVVVRGKIMTSGELNFTGNILRAAQTAKQEVDDILSRRRLHTQEAILKIMKTQKQIIVSALNAEVTQTLRSLFLPPTAFVQDCLERLIRGYLIRRNETDSNLIELVE